MLYRSLLIIILFTQSLQVFAHKASDSYLTLNAAESRVTGRWDIALRDLDYAVNLDVNNDSAITWGELRSKRELVQTYTLGHLRINSGRCRIMPTQYLVDTHTDGAYSVLLFDVDCQNPLSSLEIDYGLFFDFDPQHRGLLHISYQKGSQTAIFSPEHKQQRFELIETSPGAAFLQYLREGVRHIWTGYDHILFLLSLLLPAVFYRQAKRWHPEQQFRPVLIAVIKIVTAFTIAHSITLSLATLDVISMPSRWVESAIAVSVILAALNNLYPIVIRNLWLVAFGFGLIHGFGFANVLNDLGLPKNMLTVTLLAFNLGVEIGQLAIVGGFLPLAFWGRKTAWYRVMFFGFGSVLITVVAVIWFLERSLNLKLIDSGW
jgi:hypothetical protein